MGAAQSSVSPEPRRDAGRQDPESDTSEPSHEEERLRAALRRHRGPDASQVARWRTAAAIAISSGDLQRATHVLSDAVADVPGVVVLDEILAPAMHDIGMLWERNEITIADEHLATTVTQRLIDAVGGPPESPMPAPRGTAVLATPPSERHTAGLRMAEVVLRWAGYHPMLLGCDLPLAELSHAVARHSATVVAISATMAAPDELEATIRAVIDARPEARVILGGASARFAPSSMPLRVVATMQELLQEVSEPGAAPPRHQAPRHLRIVRGAGRRPVPDRVSRAPVHPPDAVTALLSPVSEAEQGRAALLRTAEELSQAGSCGWDVLSDRVACSPSACRILGIGEDEALTMSALLESVHPDDRDELGRLLAQARAGHPSPEVTFRRLDPGGSTRLLQAVLAAQLPRPDGVVLLAHLRDVTAARAAERQIAVLRAVTEALTAWESPARDAERLLAALAESLGFSRASLWVPTGGVLVARAWWEQADPHALAQELGELRLRRGQGLAGRAWETRALVALHDHGAPPAHRTPILARGLRGAIACPAFHAGEVIAVIALAGPDLPELTEPVRAILSSVAHQIGGFFGTRISQLRGCVLSAREVEVLQLAADGISGPEIAARLHLSPATIKTHFENIYAKYGVPDRVAAVAKALREGAIR